MAVIFEMSESFMAAVTFHLGKIFYSNQSGNVCMRGVTRCDEQTPSISKSQHHSVKFKYISLSGTINSLEAKSRELK